MGRIILGNSHHLSFKIHQGIGTDIRQRRMGAHPGGSGGGVNGKNTLAGIEKVCRIAGHFESGKCTGFYMLCHLGQNGRSRVIKQENLTGISGISGVLLSIWIIMLSEDL